MFNKSRMAEWPCCTDPLLPLPLTFRGVTSGIARLDFSIKAAVQAEKVTSSLNSQLSSPLLSSAPSYPSLTTRWPTRLCSLSPWPCWPLSWPLTPQVSFQSYFSIELRWLTSFQGFLALMLRSHVSAALTDSPCLCCLALLASLCSSRGPEVSQASSLGQHVGSTRDKCCN